MALDISLDHFVLASAQKVLMELICLVYFATWHTAWIYNQELLLPTPVKEKCHWSAIDLFVSSQQCITTFIEWWYTYFTMSGCELIWTLTYYLTSCTGTLWDIGIYNVFLWNRLISIRLSTVCFFSVSLCGSYVHVRQRIKFWRFIYRKVL